MLGTKNILLCGFMGCGKSSVGRELAKRTFREFIDLDELIEQREGMAITEIFRLRGEEGFREAEYQALCQLEHMTLKVIATGGGTVTYARNREKLRESCIVFFINPGLEDCYERIKNAEHRPLVNSSSYEELKALYDRRFPLYRQASDYEVYNHGTARDAAVAVIASLRDEF